MNVTKLRKLYLSAIWLSHFLQIHGYEEPLTNKLVIEKKFLKQRVKLARKLYPVGGKMSKNLIEADPVCGMKGWEKMELCVRIAENLYDGRRLAIGQPGIYKKSTMKPFSDNCIKGRVVLQTYRKKAVRVKLFKCTLSNYIFEKGFELKDFYIASSSSLHKVYVLRDLYDRSALHVGELKDEVIMASDGRVLFTLKEYNKIIRIEQPPQDNSSSESEMDSSAMVNVTEHISSLQNVISLDGVHFAEDGRVLVQLYALVGGMKLKRVYVTPRKKGPDEEGFWRRFWRSLQRLFTRKKDPDTKLSEQDSQHIPTHDIGSDLEE